MNVFQSISLETVLKMCVVILRTGLVFAKIIDLKGHMPSIYSQNECFPIYLLGNPKNVCWNPQNRDHFSKMINLRGHMPMFTLKNECFPIYLLGNPKMCVETLRTGIACFSKMINLRGHMPRFTLKMNVFPSIFLGNCINVCWNPQNRACLSKTINLRGHMPAFTWKMNIFQSISLETPKMCVEILRTGLVFPRWLIWGVTCLGLLSKWMFCYLSPWKPQNSVLKPSEEGSFF